MTTALDPSDSAPAPAAGDAASRSRLADPEVEHWIDGVLHRRPAVGLAVAVIRDRQEPLLVARGHADIESHRPVTGDSVFRIASLTKLFTAIAVMQLVEQGRVDLDAPARASLRAYELAPRQRGWRPASVRQLLTHTAGVPDVRRAADLLHADLTPSGGRPPLLSVRVGQPLPSLADYYRAGLPVVVEPGSAFAYSNHGFATLGQIVEDVSGMPLARYFRARIFEPLGMADTDLARSARIASRLATGYGLGPTGPRAVPDREWIGAGAAGIYSTPRDMARFVAAILGGGANAHGAILEPATLSLMLGPHYQPDARLPGMGLGFFRHVVGGHRVVGHDGILPGFNSTLLLAPDDGVGLVAFTNGSSGAFEWLPAEMQELLRGLLGSTGETTHDNAPLHPETWAGLCGRYTFPPRIADLRMRLTLGGGAEVYVGGGRLMVRLLIPIPAAYRGLPLEPDDPSDPAVFRIDPSAFGMSPFRVVFDRAADGRATAAHTDLGGMPVSLVRRPDLAVRSGWVGPALGAVAAAGLMAAVRRRGQKAGDRRGTGPGRRTD